MKATLHDSASGELIAEINCIIQHYQDPEGGLSGEEGIFDLVREHRKIAPGPATLKLGDGRTVPVVVEKLKRQASTGTTAGILWLLGKPKK